MARVARILAVALITAGLVILADVGLTLAWKEPISSILSSIRQDRAADELDEVRREFLESPAVTTPVRADLNPTRRAGQLADLFAGQLKRGKPIGRIEVPSIDADYVVLQGTDTATLQRGPGHYPDTALPGEGASIGIAGHRTTYGAPFNQIDEISIGDSIRLEMPYGSFAYEVTETRIVEPAQIGIVRDVGRERLILTACHPLYSAAQRYAVFADLSGIELAGPDPRAAEQQP